METSVAAQQPQALTPPVPSPAPEPPSPTPAQGAQPAQRPPLRIMLTILQLAAVGIFGTAVLTVYSGLIGTGIGLIPVLGIGLVILVGLVYGLFGLGWFEVQRVAGLYRLDVPPLALRRMQTRSFGGYLRALGRQTIDGRMWRAVANFLIMSLLGWVVLMLAQATVFGAVSAFGSARWTISGLSVRSGIFGPLLGLIAIALIVGVALLARVISISIIGAKIREEQLERQVARTAQERAGAVRAADVERSRIERDLHDGVQPRLVSIGMTLGIAKQRIDTDPEQAKELIEEAHTSTKAAITELRQLARGIHASVLDDRGLDAALSALAARSHVPVVLDVRQPTRCSRDAEAALYFAIAESLTNAAKHSRASECRVIVREREHELWAWIEDNGIGGARIVRGGGLDGITNRVLAAGGTATLTSPVGGPTSLEVSVPCAS
ncbi:histidine kinase [Leucobacter luti]|uniref:sensor histidine kinase n=1 Tax=Leucobacter luti TaxID=340320 RepID=UPI003CFC35DC